MSREIEVETTVGEDYSVTIPTSVREEASLSAGDPLRWRVDDAGTLSVERVEQYFGAFSELEPVDIGQRTHAAVDDDLEDLKWGLSSVISILTKCVC